MCEITTGHCWSNLPDNCNRTDFPDTEVLAIDPFATLRPNETWLDFPPALPTSSATLTESDMNNQPAILAPALATLEDVTEFARMLLATADSVHTALKRLSASSAKDPDLGYSVLTEEYAIRARANILLNDSARHTVENAGFKQADLRDFMVSTDRQIGDCASLANLLATSTDLITFASAVSSGNARILKVLAQAFGIVALETSA
jgi:hypothetical protein